jgi:hypothetical protein
MTIKTRISATAALTLATGLFISPAQADPRPQMTPEERSACLAKGGEVQPLGRLQYEACVVHFRDAGKRCSSSRQCLGKCLYPEGRPQPLNLRRRVVGQCQKTSNPFGCHTYVEHGRLKPGPCVD